MNLVFSGPLPQFDRLTTLIKLSTINIVAYTGIAPINVSLYIVTWKSWYNKGNYNSMSKIDRDNLLYL